MIETERLVLRNWQKTDIVPLISMCQDQEVMRYFPNTMTKDEVITMFDRIEEHFVNWGYGLYATEMKDTSEFIGFIGLSHPRFELDFTPCVEIGWRLASSSWNKGLATEGAKAVLQYAFDTLQIEEIYSFTALENRPSFRVMEKIGMKRIGSFAHPNLPSSSPLCEHHIYHIKAQERRL